ncbi:MAG: hypothetical protein K9L98_00175 [Candidatus Pacebacteria bacterium]|nr:hypothetical protein [Candidatus Paceibacterota bacterium]MCF7862420.1 hypothetical protein [Candidatus Paceibacterota bacterium]
MIYIFTGDDSTPKISEYEKFLKEIPSDTEVFYINRSDFDKDQIESFYSGAGLFFNQCTIVLKDIFEREDTASFVMQNIQKMASSPNLFVFLENKINKGNLDTFKDFGKGVKLFIFEKSKERKEKYDNFLLANAFASRDKLSLWMHFLKATSLGVSLEELSGVLFWKAKDMLLKKNFGKYKEEELQSFALQISYVLQASRGEGRDAEVAFERFLLEAF